MQHTVREADLRAVDALQRVLLTPPLPHELDAWRTAVNVRIRALTGADRAAFILPNCTSVVCHADIPYDADIESYPTYVRSDWGRFGMQRRALRLEVFSRAMLYHPHDREVYRSDYFNEAVVPARAYDSLSMTCRTSGREDLVQLIVHHDRPTGRKFGARELQLMRLLFPAFAAGVGAYRAIEGRIETLGTLLDRGHDGVALYSQTGVLVHCNALAAELLDDAGIARVVRRMVDGPWSGRAEDTSSLRPLLVDTTAGRMRIRGCIADDVVVAGERLALVFFERTDPATPELSADALRGRFQLTRQQARIALLLGERRSNAEIADCLSVSVHTVKRHVEQVLARLGVASRLEVRQAIRAAEGD